MSVSLRKELRPVSRVEDKRLRAGFERVGDGSHPLIVEPDIQDGGIEIFPFDKRQGVRHATDHADDGGSRILQDFLQRHGDQQLVLDDHDPAAFQVLSGHRAFSREAGLSSSLLVWATGTVNVAWRPVGS